jgi:hypothetical protein
MTDPDKWWCLKGSYKYIKKYIFKNTTEMYLIKKVIIYLKYSEIMLELI